MQSTDLPGKPADRTGRKGHQTVRLKEQQKVREEVRLKEQQKVLEEVRLKEQQKVREEVRLKGHQKGSTPLNQGGKAHPDLLVQVGKNQRMIGYGSINILLPLASVPGAKLTI